MRPTPNSLFEPFRIQIPQIITDYGDPYGMFVIPYVEPPALHRTILRCIVGSGEVAMQDLGKDFAWDHISVSVENRCPTWAEMTYVKDIFFTEDETVFQFHPPKSQYVNFHPYTLHLWKPLLVKIPLPPKVMVGPS